MKLFTFLIIFGCFLSTSLTAQTTIIPDNNFEQALIDLGYDSGPLNGSVPTANINTVLSLDLINKNITSLTGIQDFTSLINLYCYTNLLTNLDVSQNTALTFLDCSDNYLSSLNVKNGNNTNFTYFDASLNNPYLDCIEVDDAVYSTTNWTNIDPQSFFSEDCNIFVDLTYVPDDNFEQALIDLGYDSGIPDDFVPTDNINYITHLYIYDKNITDLTGIEDFVALTNLSCYNNLLTSIDISQNTALTSLHCYSNQLSSINVTQNTALTNLSCSSNLLTSLDVTQNTALTHLSCSSNLLTSIDVSQNTALTSLQCSNNQLPSLDVFQNTALTSLSCNQNSLTSLDITQNIALTNLRCFSNQLISLDISQNTVLAILHCYSNLITNLDVTQNTALTYLHCGDNSLTSLDVSQNPALTQLHCHSNQLVSLDITQNTDLIALRCHSNNLTNFNAKNGNNTNITLFTASSNPNLLCIEVDDAVYSTTNWTVIDPQSSFNENCHYGETYVPDDNFEQALIDLGYDTILDDYVLTTTINTLTFLNINNKSIADLTGIEDFIALTILSCNNNSLTSIDISQNVALSNLQCYSNQLSSLDVTQNTALTKLYCQENVLTSLDVTQNSNLTNLTCYNNLLTNLDVTQNTALTTLSCYNNLLTSLNITQNTALTGLHCYANQLTNLDVSQNTVLTSLHCYANQITNLDISQSIALTSLYCYSNQISNLDVSQNTAITNLFCYSNQITDLDLTQNVSLSKLDCSANQLISLNVKNGNNTNFAVFNAINNPNLLCIEVDNAPWSTTNWTNIDATASFSESCAKTYIPDDNFEQALIDLGYDAGILDDYVPTINISTITSLDISNKNITDLTGIEDFAALTDLNCNDNSLNTIDISNNIALTLLRCDNNSLSTLDISNNTALISLRCKNNLLSTLDLSNNSFLNIDCSYNSITSLDVSNSTDLTTLFCEYNSLVSLDLSSNTSLTWLRCSNNNLSSLNVKNGNNTNMSNSFFRVTNNPNLTCINVDDASWSTINWTNIDAQSDFSEDCSDLTYVPDDNFEQILIDLGYDSVLDNYVITTNINVITSLSISNENIADLTGIENFTALNTLNCSNNSITTLNLSNNIALTSLSCNNNSLNSLDISSNTALTNLSCSNNSLTTLDVSNNTVLTQLSCSSNSLSSLNVSNNSVLTELICYSNSLNSLVLGNNTSLTKIWCYNNSLSSLDLSNATALTSLVCGNNSLSSLDVSNNTALEGLTCKNNQLIYLDVSNNILLVSLVCNNNSIISLDISQNTSLFNLKCFNNQLTSLNAKNGNNTNFTFFDATNNLNLTCIEVDDAPWSTTNWTNIDATASFNENCNACIVNIPDATFKSLLVGDATINTNSDSEIQCDEASAFTGSISVSYWSILDLTGIEAFTALTTLNCNNNNLTSLDVSQNTALTTLNCSDNPIGTLDVAQNINLETLYCATNSLSTLDITQNTFLIDLDCNDNSLTTLNLSQNTALEILRCNDNQLTSINLDQNTFLYNLDCSDNLLNTLNLSLNADLESLVCGNNSLSTLDLSQNTVLDFLICTHNTPLTSLNVANGNNINFSYFRANSNSNLSCIQVDDAAWSTTNWTNIDPQTSFSEDCNTKIWENGAWTNGLPLITDIAIIRDNYSTTLQAASINSNSLIIDVGYTLTIGDGDYLQTQNNITVNGNLIVEHQGSVVQINDLALTTNNGNIQVEKTMSSFNDGTDFSIFGSPMTGETRDGTYANNNVVMNHITSNFIPNTDVETLDPLAENFADDNGDNWQFFSGSEAIIPGAGYLVGGITGGGTFTNTYTQGTLNNGSITFNTIYNGTQNASPNIISNPYASAIDADVLIANNTIIDELYFWEHLTAPTNTYPGYRSENWSMGDISMYNLSGGVVAANGGNAPTQFIPSGQGFAIKANAAGTITFNNAMRVTGNNTGYRNNNETINKFYLKVKNQAYRLKSTTLITFTPDATNGIDASYDAKRLATPISIYSTVANQELAIQGRSVFNQDQIIPIGFRTLVEELQEYTISLGLIEGLEITNTTLYLQDNVLNTITNLSETDYNFTSENGNFSNRFLISFREENLGLNEASINTISLYPNPVTNQLTISSISTISKISIIDVSGRLIRTINTNEVTNLTIDLSQLSAATYFIKVQNQQGNSTKRILKK